MVKFKRVTDNLIQVFGLPLKVELAIRQDGKVVAWFLDYRLDRWKRTWGCLGIFPNVNIAKVYIERSITV